MKILAIDDNQDNLTTLKAVAQDALPGSRLLTALDGPRGLALAQAEDPDVILLDIVMPGMDGFEVCRQLKANARLSSIPVVFLTALRTDRESRIRALEAGAEAFLSKPIDELELTAQIRAMVRLKVANRMQRMEKEELAALVAERTRQLEVELAERKHAEVELNRVAEEWQTTFDSTADAIWVLDNQHRVLRSNQAAEKMFGRPRSEMLCEACWTLAHGTTEPHPNCPFVRARQSGHREAMELEQNDRWFEITVDPVRDHTSEITGAVHIASDITERKQIEAIQTFLAKTSSGMTKEPFFNALARFLAENLRMNFVCIDRLEGDGLNARTVAVWHDGKFEDNVTYALKDTPCGDVVGQHVCCFPANVCQLFPRDPVLQDLRAESYAGVTLFDHAGAPIGLIAAIGRAPLANRAQVEAALKMVAGRAAGELERQQAEAALRENQDQLRSLYDSMTEGVALHALICDAGGQAVDYILLDANPAFETITGLRRQAVIGRLASEIYGGNPPYLETYAAVAASGRPVKFESEYAPMQKTFAISVFSPAKKQFATVFADITERKQTEAIQTFLAQTSSGMTEEPFFNALARFLAENLRMNFVCIDRLEGDGLNARTVAVWHDGKFEDNVTYALKDTPCGDVVGQQVCCFPANVCQLFPRDPVLQDLRAESYAGVTLFDHTGRPIGLIAVIGRMPLTNRSQAEAALKMVAGRAAGELERQQAEAALRESEERHRTLYEQASDGILLMTAEGEIVGLNKAFAQMHGYSEPEMMGMNVKDLDGPEDARVLSDRVRRITEGGTLTFEVMHYHKDGHLFPIAVSCCQITLAGKFYVQTICRDITEQKRLEAELRQSQKMESIGHLAGGVAHDFNNILASQILQLDLIQSGVVAPEEIAEAIRQIHADAERAAKLVRQLLLFSRRQVMQPGALDLNEVVNNISKLLRRIIGEDIWMQVRLHPAPLNLVADAGMLEQVIVNFATNARDAMPKGGQLLIETSAATLTEADAQRLKAEGGPGAYICLSVSDTGTGIPPEVVSKIFEPFFTTKDVGKGTGLGLASVFGIVKQHKGGIDVDNRPGKGVTFRVYLPTHTASATPPRLTANQPRIRGRAETILLVEDEPSLRKLMIRLLECHGYQVLPAANGVAALELWRQQRDAVALLCTDMVLPEGMSGSELAGHLRAEKPELKVLYVSGYSRDAVENRLNLSAGETFMQKPFLPEQLLETVHRCLNGVPQSQ